MPTPASPKRPVLYLILTLLIALIAGFFLATHSAALAQEQPRPEADSTGEIIGAEPLTPESPPEPHAPSQVSLMCFSTEGACTRIGSLFPNAAVFTSLSNFPTDLSPYDVVYLGNNEGDALDSKSAQLQTYVNDGGGLVVTQPNIPGQVDLFPPGFEMFVEDLGYNQNTASQVEFTPAGEEHPILAGLGADDVSGNFDTVPLDRVGPGWTVLVKEIHQPVLALAVGHYGSGRMAFHTGNTEAASIDPGSDAYVRQLIEWAGSAGTATGPDMEIEAIEVTQAIQDLDNSVPLVAGKRTYVRVHVSAPNYVPDVFANLSATRGSTRLYPTLSPGNPGADISIWYDSADRGQINDSFWFELPPSWTTAGTLELTATLDPAVAKGDPNYANNTESVAVNFEQTPPLRLNLFNVRYTMGGTTYLAGNQHLNSLESWLERAYPIPDLQRTRYTFTYPQAGLPDVDELHGYLALGKLLNIIFNDEDPRTVYYGLVDDGGDFMRGKALDIPSTIAAGPAGTPGPGIFNWDDDNSYADWYGGHEIGHTQGRYHAEFCGAADGRPYPYTGGDISPDTTGTDEQYGFDIADRTVYDPNWHDVMTYCNDQWISKFTYEGIHDHLVSEGRAPTIAAGQFVVVVASVDLDTKTGAIDNLYLLEEEGNAPLPESGGWTLALLDANDSALATYEVAAHELTDGEQAEGRPGFITAVVPAESGLDRVEIRYGGELVDAREMSANPPTVTITAPEDGDEFGSGPITFSWQGDDPDGDTLTYSVFYSYDDGTTWNPLATGLPGETLTIDSDNLPGGVSRLKVVANDGMRSASDTTASFYPPAKAPEVTIVAPQDGATFWQAQLVTLRADVYDPEEGALGGSNVVWTSSIDGELGTGTQLSTVNLSTGSHTITVEATDSTARTAQAQVTIDVVPGDTPEPVRLAVSPGQVSHTAIAGFSSPAAYTATLRSSSGMTLTWTISETADWLSLTPTGGDTPGTATMTIDPAGKAAGDYQAIVTFTAGNAENTPVEVPVRLTVEPPMTALLPMVIR